MGPDHKALIDQLLAALGRDPRVRSVWLSGSFSRGAGDAWSDVDLTVTAEAQDIAPCLADYHAPRADLPKLVFSQILHGRVLTAITEDWRRFDLAFLTPEELPRQDGADLRHLLGDAEGPPPRPPGADPGAAKRVTALVTEFLRVLGLSPVAVGREEWLVMQQGVELLRKMTVDLMVEEAGLAPAARGAKRVNPFLTSEQRALLEALPSPGAERHGLIDANLAIARLFLTRARPLAARLGAEWPEAFERATREHLRAALSFDLP